MNTKEIWKRVQDHVGAVADGVPGRETATLVAQALGVSTADAPRPMPVVTGRGKNIRRIVIHCAATPEGRDFDVDDVKRWHTAPKPQGRGWSRIGYHFIIKLDGTVQRGLPESRTGIHVRGRNTGSIGVCYIGGVDASGRAKDTRTDAQKLAMQKLVSALTKVYPNATVLGHRDHAGVRKACPSFDAKSWWESVK